jgi:heat shock protein HslJ
MQLISKSLLLSLGLLTILSGCTNEQSITTPSISIEDLQTPRWSLDKVDDKELDLEISQRAPSISVDEQLMATGYTGCNHFFSEVSIKRDQIKLSKMNSTMKLCLKPQTDLDTQITKVLSDWSYVYIDRGVMTLTGNGHTLTFKAKRK